MRAALAFLTPLGGARAPSPRALPWFPVIIIFVASSVGEGTFALAGWMIGEDGLVNGHLPTIMLVVAILGVLVSVADQASMVTQAGRGVR